MSICIRGVPSCENQVARGNSRNSLCGRANPPTSATRSVMIPVYFIESSCVTGPVSNSPPLSIESSRPEHTRFNRSLEGRVLLRDLRLPRLDSTPLRKPSPPAPLPSDGRGWRRTLLVRGGEGKKLVGRFTQGSRCAPALGYLLLLRWSVGGPLVSAPAARHLCSSSAGKSASSGGATSTTMPLRRSFELAGVRKATKISPRRGCAVWGHTAYRSTVRAHVVGRVPSHAVSPPPARFRSGLFSFAPLERRGTAGFSASGAASL